MTSHGGRDEFRRGWGVLLASTTGFAFGVASLAISYTIGVFIGPLQAEFGWDKAQILVASTIVSVVVGSLTFVVGWLADRVDLRRLVIGSQLAFGLGFFALGLFVNGLVSFYLLYFLLAVAGVSTTAVPFAKIITTRFTVHRGLALGIAMSGTGLCGFLVPPYVAFVVENFGWRAGYFAIGLLPLLISLPLTILFLRNEREQPTGDDAESAPIALAGSDHDPNFRQALLNYRFWVLFAIFFVASCVMTALITNYVPILQDQGYGATQAAAMAGSFGIAVVTGRIVVGYLIDRLWAPLIGFLIFMPAAAAIALLGEGGLGTTALVATILLSGFAAGAEVDLMGYLVSRYFGLRHFGKIYAAVYIGFALGPGLTNPVFGWSRDQSGSYASGISFIAFSLVAAALLFLTLGRYPNLETPVDSPDTG